MGIIKKLFSGGEKKQFVSMEQSNLLSSLFSRGNMYKTYNHYELLSMYKGWIFAASDAIGDGMAMLDWRLYKDENKLDILDHPYIDLINSKTIKAISIFLKTLGEVYFYKEMMGKKIISLKMLKSWNVVEVKGNLGDILYYQYYDGKNFYKFLKEDLLIFKSFSPLFEQSGMTPLKAAASQMAMDLASIEYNRLFFENGGRPGTILKHTAKIDENIRNAYLQKWKDNFVGLQNSNKVAFLDQGIELQDFSANQKDMELTNQRAFTRDEILMMFRVGTPILGKSDGVGFADKRVPGYYLTQYALKPLGEMIKEDLNKQLFKDIGYFTFEFPEDKEDLLKEYQANVITLNQYLSATGRPNVVGGDRLWDGTEISLETIKTTHKSSIKTNLEQNFEKMLKKKEFGTDEYNEEFWNTKIKRTDKYEEEMMRVQKKIWKMQENEIIENLKTEKNIKEIKKESDLFDKKKYNLLYITLYTTFFNNLMQKEGQLNISEISDETFAIAKLNKWIGENIDRMSSDIDTTTRKEIFNIIKQGNRDEVGVGTIVASVNAKFLLYTKKKGRVETITRTEITRASNKSQQEAYNQSGVVAYKEWYTAIDERRCEYCGDLHGKTIELESSFFKEGESHLGEKITYENINFPPRHPNCRCTIRPIIKRNKT